MNWSDKITVTNEDCMELLKRTPDKFYDLSICDPPYGIKRAGHRGNKKFGWKKHNFKNWDNEIPNSEYFKQLFRVSKNQIIWGANYFTKYLPSSKGWIFWDKGQDLTMSDGELAFTSFDVALRRKIMNRVEILKDGSIHPTQKPVALYKWLLDKYAKPGDKILDTYLGSGSIAIACHDYGFELTACELDKEYYDAAYKRFKNHASQQKLF